VATDKALIISVDTLAGANIALTWSGRCEVVGISSRRRFALDGCRVIAAGDDRCTLEEAVDAEAPDTLVLCGPTSRSAWDRSQDPDTAAQSQRLAAACQAAKSCGSRVVIVSSDAECSGPHLFRRDNDVPPIDGVSGGDDLIVHTHLFGWSPTGDSCFEQLWAAICHGRPCRASGTRYASPILATDFADLLWKARTKGLHGKYNLACAERANMWQVATALAAAARLPLGVMRFDPSLTEDTSAGQETSLDSRHAQRALETRLPRLSDGIDRFVEQATSGYRDRIAATLAMPALASSAA